jgi:hypothetical protein
MLLQLAQWEGASRGLLAGPGQLALALDKSVELAGAHVVMDVAAASRLPLRLVWGAGWKSS